MRARRVFFPFLLGLAPALHAQTAEPPPEPPVQLDPLPVTATSDDAGYDATGMGSLDEQLRDAPFANDLIRPVDPQLDESMTADLGSELAAVANPPPAERLSGEERLNLRGFPTPIMRKPTRLPAFPSHVQARYRRAGLPGGAFGAAQREFTVSTRVIF